MTSEGKPQRMPGGIEVRLSPFGSKLAILVPGREAWCVQLDTMRGQYRPVDEVAHWTRLVPATQ